MSKYHGKGTQIYWDEFNLSGMSSSVTINRDAPTVDTSCFTATDTTAVVGMRSWNAAVSSFWDDTTTTGTHAIYQADFATADHTISIYPSGITAGMRGWGNYGVIQTSFNTTGPVAGAVTAEANHQGSGELEALWCLGGSTSTTAGSLTLASYNLAASLASTGMAGYLHVTALSGSPDVAFVIQDSPDDATFTDLVTFTNASAATSERVAVTGSSSQYFRVKYTLGASTTSCTFVVGFHR
ncbi:MAG: hypothetical protein M0R06_01080 [Sphaerochaeta sp.]|jgi:hypothetical protein|nr:hypothetical protein [Sphaerochaeta sp.]